MTCAQRLARLRALLRSLVKDEEGQGMTEYAATSTILLLGGVGVIGGWPFFGMLINGLDAYLKSVYFVLHTSFP